MGFAARIRADGGVLPEGTDLTAHMNDALDTQPIVGPFMPWTTDPPDQDLFAEP